MRNLSPKRRMRLAMDILEERVALAAAEAPHEIQLVEHAGVLVHHQRASNRHVVPAARELAANSTYPFEDPILPEYPAMSRLAEYNATTGEFDSFTAPNTITNSTETPTNVYVISHGWAAGYLDWVKEIQTQTGHPLPLSWNTWQGTGKKPYYGATTPWLFKSSKTGIGAFKFTVSDKGLAQQILSVDPNAKVLAFSWIDDSASPTGFGGYPLDPFHSEGNTTMNGMRMAQGIMDVLSPTYYDGPGKVHLLGHSHGARVATEAALALQRAAKINPQFNVLGQLTLFDSPENNRASTNDRNPIHIDAANYDWFLLSQLNIGRPVNTSGSLVPGQSVVTFQQSNSIVSSLVVGMGVKGAGITAGTTITGIGPSKLQVTLSNPAGSTAASNEPLAFSPPPGTVFVDSYNSYFGSDLGNFVVNDPEQGIDNKHLSNMVDVELVALNRAYYADEYSRMHQYAANWYAGSVVTTPASKQVPVGMMWSPLLAAPQPVPAEQQKQGWSYIGAVAKNQFKLQSDPHKPVTPKFINTSITAIKSVGGVSTTANKNDKFANVTLSSAQGTAEFDGKLHKEKSVVGFSFECDFTQVGDGSQLQLLFNGKVYFAMSGGVADTTNLPGNADFNTTVGFAKVGNDPKVTLRLVKPASSVGTPTSVIVRNFQEFTV